LASSPRSRRPAIRKAHRGDPSHAAHPSKPDATATEIIGLKHAREEAASAVPAPASKAARPDASDSELRAQLQLPSPVRSGTRLVRSVSAMSAPLRGQRPAVTPPVLRRQWSPSWRRRCLCCGNFQRRCVDAHSI
jgi:hypothetical protein